MPVYHALESRFFVKKGSLISRLLCRSSATDSTTTQTHICVAAEYNMQCHEHHLLSPPPLVPLRTKRMFKSKAGSIPKSCSHEQGATTSKNPLSTVVTGVSILYEKFNKKSC